MSFEEQTIIKVKWRLCAYYTSNIFCNALHKVYLLFESLLFNEKFAQLMMYLLLSTTGARSSIEKADQNTFVVLGLAQASVTRPFSSQHGRLRISC